MTKSTRLNAQEKLSRGEKSALASFAGNEHVRGEIENELVHKETACTSSSKAKETTRSKRKRIDEAESDSESSAGDSSGLQKKKLEAAKKRKILVVKQQHLQLIPEAKILQDEVTTTGSNRIAIRHAESTKSDTLQLSQTLLDLISMHAAFLKALSLHFAHNGASTPAELNGLADSMTRLWKKHTVRGQDLQRMLGAYEVFSKPEYMTLEKVERKECPFEMTTSGLGLTVRTTIRYVAPSKFDEGVLQAAYFDAIQRLSVSDPFTDECPTFPLLTVHLGTQTSLHRAKAAATRAEILSLSASAQSRSTPDFSKLSISDPSEHTPASVKSRTLSLFDRVRAKGLESANNAALTSEQILRRRATGRITEIVEFLRMKQHQKLSVQFHGSVHDTHEKVRETAKVSFSLGAIVRDIQQSVGVPIGEDEVRLCLRILSREVPGDWCRIIEFGTVTGLTLQGHGMSGVEVKKLLETTK